MSNSELRHISGKGDRTSFFKLFVENDFRIVIPMLQREYAQGRDSATEVRIEFLKALYGYLDEGIPERDLDFIYGNISGNDFIPLDGQQRLTTLFLLHWYLSQITPDSSLKQEFNRVMMDATGRYCRFTYKTRTSSSEFCDALMSCDIDFDNLLPESMKSQKRSLKRTIEDKNWFHLSWKHDPTIMSMLNMLESIHTVFNGRADFFPKLLDTSKPVITFLFMELDKYQLSDELYIKMNSRGKPLTDFENFKARYSEHIGDLIKKPGKQVYRTRTFSDGTKLELPLDQFFAERIDNAWTNMLWAYRDEDDSDELTDEGLKCDKRMANLLRALLSLKYVELHPLTKGETDPAFVSLVNQSGRESLSFITLRDGGALSLESTVFLTDAMDLLSESGGKVESHLAAEYQHCFPLTELMGKILHSPRELNYNDRVMLYAYLGYLLKYGADDGINQWMRVVYNLANVDNNRIDSANELSNSIKSIKCLLDFAPQILKYLSEGKTVEGFPTWLVEEERVKSSLILRNDGDKWLKHILMAEKHGYFNGQIGFILEFAGIMDFYGANQSVGWSDAENEGYLAMFQKYSADARAVFAESYENRVNDADFAFERAVLFKGDYLLSRDGQRYNMLSTSAVRNNVKRDYSWKHLLRLDKDADATERRGFVKAVFDDSAFDYNNPNESLKLVFEGKSTGDQWRDFLIKYSSAIDYSGQGFISFYYSEHDLCGVFPMATSRLSGYHIELYSFGLQCDLEEMPCDPFSNGMRYVEVKGADELPHILFEGYELGQAKFNLAIYAQTNAETNFSLQGFRLEFFQTEGTPIASDVMNQLPEHLIADRHEQNDSASELTIYLSDIPAVQQFLPQFFETLASLKSR